MSFDELERSNYDAIPTTLYEFSIGLNVWRYASGEADVPAASGAPYRAVPISDTGIVQSGDVQNDDLTVTLPAGEGIAALFIATPPSDPVFLVMRRLNRGDTETPTVWVGTVKAGKRADLASFALTCKVLTSSLNRNGLRLAWSKGCPHALYDRNCRADPDDFGVAMSITTLTGSTIASAALASKPSGYFAGGYFEWELLPGVMERRAIESHVGGMITVMGTTDGLAPTDMIAVYPGCDRISSTCDLKFNNLSNYGGFAQMPSKSPFDGDPVF